jgi:hypothetical protein
VFHFSTVSMLLMYNDSGSSNFLEPHLVHWFGLLLVLVTLFITLPTNPVDSLTYLRPEFCVILDASDSEGHT